MEQRDEDGQETAENLEADADELEEEGSRWKHVRTIEIITNK